MSYGAPDPYYQPGSFGLEVIGDVEWEDEPYQFDITAVWRSLDNRDVYYWGDDYGCSCPSPFEWCHSLDELHSGSVNDAISHLSMRMVERDATNADMAAANLIDRLITGRND